LIFRITNANIAVTALHLLLERLHLLNVAVKLNILSVFLII